MLPVLFFFFLGIHRASPGSCQSKSLGKEEEEEERTVAFLDPEAVAAAAFYGRHRGKYLFSTSQSTVWERTGSKKKYFEEGGGAQS